jgi:hypothetical protein
MFELLKNLFAKPNFRYSPTSAQDLPLSTALLDIAQIILADLLLSTALLDTTQMLDIIPALKTAR